MGYYSDVAMIMKRNDFEEMKKAYEKEFEDNDNEKWLLDERYEAVEFRPVDDVMICYWNDVDWYYDFPCIKWLLDYLDNMDEEGRPWGLLRVGEDMNDVGEDFGGDGGWVLMNDYMGIKREIVFLIKERK